MNAFDTAAVLIAIAALTGYINHRVLKLSGHCQLGVTVRCSASRSFALARSARTRRRIPFDERPLSEHAVVPRPE